MASDGRWYPPEQWTGPAATGPAAPASPSIARRRTRHKDRRTPHKDSASGVPGTPYANDGSGGQPRALGAPYVQAVRPKTNGLAIASLVCSCAGIFLIGIPAVLGIIFGFVPRRSNGRTGSRVAVAWRWRASSSGSAWWRSSPSSS